MTRGTGDFWFVFNPDEVDNYYPGPTLALYNEPNTPAKYQKIAQDVNQLIKDVAEPWWEATPPASGPGRVF